MKGLALYCGTYPVELFLIGVYPAKVHDLIRSLNIGHCVTLTGKLVGTNLVELFDRCHIAVGSLGLHRLNIVQGSTLKVCEYLMRGIPFIVAHHEMELIETESIHNLFLQLPANDKPVDINCVIEFAKGAMADHNHVTKLRRFAEQHVTMERKALELKQFLEHLKDLR